LITHLTERLAGGDDGKDNIFRDSAVENLFEFFQRFRHLNLRSNVELDELVAQAQRVVRNSTKTGDDLRICLDRKYLLRATNLGFSRYGFYGDDGTILAHDDRRSYLWMACQPAGILPPENDCLHIDSPLDRRTSVTVNTHSISPWSTHVVTKRTPPPQVPVTVAVAVAEPTSVAPPVVTPVPPVSVVLRRQRERPIGHQATGHHQGPLERVLAMREQLRCLLVASKDLLRTLKAEKRQQRLLKATLASLKQLQSVA